MREIADQARIEAFLAALAREATAETAVYLVGGTSAVLDAEVRRQFALLEPQLSRFPAIDPPSFRRAVDAVFPP